MSRSSALTPSSVKEIRFWGQSVALYRDAGGLLHAIEDRCAHRQVKLSLGTVEGACLKCPYHGWSYGGDGRLERIPHDLFGHRMPNLRLRSYPVEERYGLIWIFFGDPALAEERPLPRIPEIEGPRPWAQRIIEFHWRAHHSMVTSNVADFTHDYLHRKYAPFVDVHATSLDDDAETVHVRYEMGIGKGPLVGMFVDRKRMNATGIDIWYRYPHLWADIDGKFKQNSFLLPVDERNTDVFMLFYMDTIKIPFVPLAPPLWLVGSLFALLERVVLRSVLDQDGWAVEREQEGFDRRPDAPSAEVNPVVGMCDNITVRKWDEHMARGAVARAAP